MNLADAHATALALMARHGLKGWTFTWDRSVRQFGVCRHGPNEIGLSRRLVEMNTEEQVRDTILHEIAHALCEPHEGHGAAWKRKCLEVGAKPVRCYQSKDVRAPAKRFSGKCRCRVRLKDKRRRGAYCRLCGETIQWELNLAS